MLEYELTHGDNEKGLIAQLVKNGDDLPDFIKNKPKLIHESLHFYLQAFFLLETERVVGFSILPIPITKIIEYGKYLGYDRYDMSDFIAIIRALDDVALKHYNKDKSKNAKSKS